MKPIKYMVEFDTDPTISTEIDHELIIGDFAIYETDGKDGFWVDGIVYKREFYKYEDGEESDNFTMLTFYVKTIKNHNN